jgi:ABC-type nitrate/sulfonate/bicarbonate transport system substrate-binding protein
VAVSNAGILQVGRRSMVACAALVVPPTSDIYASSELINRTVGIDYGNGTAYAALQMLDGAVSRDAMKTIAVTSNAGDRFRSIMRGDYDCTVLQEPWITVAEKAGCRLISTTFFYGTWVAGPGLDVEAYSAFVRAITRAVHRINADKLAYVPYFIRAASSYPEVAALRPEDFNLNRIQAKEPGPVPEDQARWNWAWMASFGILQGDFDLAAQIDQAIEERAYASVSVS